MTKQQAIYNLMRSENMYIIFSQRTKMPFVICDPETMDDQIYVYFDEEEAKKEAQRFMDAGDPCGIFKLSNKRFLPFYMNLYSMGVNCVVTGHHTDSCYAIQLEEFLKRNMNPDPKDIRTVENPEFQLTALYFLQEITRKNRNSEAAKELEQEMNAHFQRATFLMPFQKDKKGILLEGDGHKYQPLFTDFFEFDRFNKEKKLIAIPVKTEILIENFPKNADGVIINPAAMNLLLNIAKKPA